MHAPPRLLDKQTILDTHTGSSPTPVMPLPLTFASIFV